MLRRVAYLLVVLGFLWLALIDVETQMKAGIRPVIEAEYAKLEPTPRNYGKDEVQKFMRDAVVAGYSTRPGVRASWCRG